MDHKRIALVTGANQGVGFQVAKELVEDGVTVLVGSRNFKRGVEAAGKIGAGAIPVQLDVTDRASIAEAAERIRTEFGRLDLLVNNAAISNTRMADLSLADYIKISEPSNVSIDEVRAIWDTNGFGVLAVYQAMLPLLGCHRTPASSTSRAMSARWGSTPTPASPTARSSRPAMRPPRPASTP